MSDTTQSKPGLVWGIVSLVFAGLGLLPGFGILMSLIGLFCAVKARRIGREAGNPTAVTCGTIGLVLSLVTLVIAGIGLIALLGVGGALLM